MGLVPAFTDIAPPAPSRAKLEQGYKALHGLFDGANSDDARRQAITQWNGMRKNLATWSNWVELRYHQDTTNAQFKKDKELLDELQPFMTECDTKFKERLLSLDEAALAALVGKHAARMWKIDVTTFDPVITDDLKAQSKLQSAYIELLASASFKVGEETVSLAQVSKFRQSPDRALRHEAEAARWGFFAQNSGELDRIYDELVKLRTGMAKKLGDQSFTDLGYRLMRRMGYGPAEVTAYRDAIATHIVPLARSILERRAAIQGLDRMMFWDEDIADPAGNPAPNVTGRTFRDRAAALFDHVGQDLGRFYRDMDQGGYLDLESRAGKAGGGFCTSLPDAGMPFVFANFNGSHGDVTVFNHEIGHAFQWHSSKEQPLIDLEWPTYEAAEISSMALEFLTHPRIDLFFAPEEADRYRRVHLEDAILFLPFGVAIDHFQHLVYAKPDATPAERHAMWQEVERLYMPWRDYGDLPHCPGGAMWQHKHHVYLAPFYYIDYTLAQAVALQLWALSLKDAKGAWTAYAGIASRGGSATFTDLVTDAGLYSPFDPRAIEQVAAAVKKAVGL